MDDLDPNSLLERLKRAQGPDPELDRLIWMAAHAGDTQPETGSQDAAYAFTGSLDAIFWLVSTRLPDWSGSVSFTRGVAIQSAGLWRSEPRANCVGTAATPVLALCAAFVQALMTERDGRAANEVQDAQEL